MNSDDVSQLIEALITKYLTEKSVFFVGAGISVDSGYPNFQRLSETLILTASQNYISGEDAEYLSKHLRPEVIYQIGQDVFGEEILLSMEVLERGKPNVYHYFLAEAIKRGCSVFTTNVDNLIEAACRERGLEPERDFSICHGQKNDRDYKNSFNRLVSDGIVKPYLFKLHGTIADNDSELKKKVKKYKSIQFALNQVGRGLFRYRSGILSYFHHNYDFFFLGYSGMDDFSVLPAITSTESIKSTCWCEYDEGPLVFSSLDRTRPQWELHQEENQPLAQDRDEGKININKILVSRGAASIIKGKFSRFIETRILKDLKLKTTFARNETAVNMPLLDKFAKKRPAWEYFLFGMSLFEEVLMWDKAIQYGQKASTLSNGQQTIVQKKLADVYYKEASQELSEKAIGLYQEQVDKLGPGRERGLLKVKIANTLRRLGPSGLDQAIALALEAKREFELPASDKHRQVQLNKDLNYAQCLNILGLSLYSEGKYEDAKEAFNKSIRIKKTGGDVNGIAESENALSLIYTQEGRRFVAEGKFTEAKARFKQAILHANRAVLARRKIGNRRGFAQNCRNLAWPNTELMKISSSQDKIRAFFLRAQDAYTAGLSAWRQVIPPPSTEIITFTNILVGLYNDYCQRIANKEEKKRWISEGLKTYEQLFQDLRLLDQARSEQRTPTATNNLTRLKELAENARFQEEAATVQRLIEKLLASGKN